MSLMPRPKAVAAWGSGWYSFALLKSLAGGRLVLAAAFLCLSVGFALIARRVGRDESP